MCTNGLNQREARNDNGLDLLRYTNLSGVELSGVELSNARLGHAIRALDETYRRLRVRLGIDDLAARFFNCVPPVTVGT